MSAIAASTVSTALISGRHVFADAAAADYGDAEAERTLTVA